MESSTTFIDAIASSDLSPTRILQCLEGLFIKISRHPSQHNISGPLYEPRNAGLLFRERKRLGKLATGVTTSELLADKVAHMHRYIVPLEYLMLIMKSHDGLCSARSNKKKCYTHTMMPWPPKPAHSEPPSSSVPAEPLMLGGNINPALPGIAPTDRILN